MSVIYPASAGFLITVCNVCHERARLQDVIGRVESGTETGDGLSGWHKVKTCENGVSGNSQI